MCKIPLLPQACVNGKLFCIPQWMVMNFPHLLLLAFGFHNGTADQKLRSQGRSAWPLRLSVLVVNSAAVTGTRDGGGSPKALTEFPQRRDRDVHLRADFHRSCDLFCQGQGRFSVQEPARSLILFSWTYLTSSFSVPLCFVCIYLLFLLFFFLI